MGSIHNELRRGSLSKAIKNALDVTDGESGIERFGETLTPVVDLWERPEWAFLRNEKLWAFNATIAASALNFGRIQIDNPDRSGVLVIVEGVSWIAAAAAGTLYRLGTMGAVAATPAASPARDLRLGTAEVTISVSRIGNDLPAPSGTAVEIQANEIINQTMKAHSTPYVLSEGHRLEITQVAINTAFRANMWGRERQVAVGERA